MAVAVILGEVKPVVMVVVATAAKPKVEVVGVAARMKRRSRGGMSLSSPLPHLCEPKCTGDMHLESRPSRVLSNHPLSRVANV